MSNEENTKHENLISTIASNQILSSSIKRNVWRLVMRNCMLTRRRVSVRGETVLLVRNNNMWNPYLVNLKRRKIKLSLNG